MAGNIPGLAGFCQSVEKTGFFPRKKTGVAKIVYAGKNSFFAT